MPIKCPACNTSLTPQTVGKITVDICEGGCGGLWLDAFELDRLKDAPDTATEILLHIATDHTIQVDPTCKRQCPRCDEIKLKRRYFSPQRSVEIDECPGCAGIWLDAGELQTIRNELHASSTPPPTNQLSMALIRKIYRLRLEQQETPEP
jgi:Zn-finger nucleic acid-binding protein